MPKKLTATERESRFWSRIAINDGCWEWQGARKDDRYGEIGVAGKITYTHRYAWELTRGAIPSGMAVLHHCDNPPCVNPDHLFLGTHQDNMRDKVTKGRQARGATHGSQTHPEALARGDKSGYRLHPERFPHGEGHHWTKLSETQVATIRDLWATGRYFQSELAAAYGVHYSTISLLVNDRRRAVKGLILAPPSSGTGGTQPG